MSLKCSVFGHRFGDSTVDREREEEGSEVVITIREVETCTRCGEQRVVSENKEVTTLETPDVEDDSSPVGTGADGAPTVDQSGGSPASGSPEPAADEPDGTPESSPASGRGDDPKTETTDPRSAEADDGSDVGPGSTVGSTEPGGVAGSTNATTDDAEILDDEPDREPDAEPVDGGDPVEPDDEGEPVVPDAESSGAPGAGPGVGGTDEGDDSTDPETDDGIILDDEPSPGRQPGEWPEDTESREGDGQDSEEDDESESLPGEWPEEPDDDGPDWEPPSLDEVSDTDPDDEPTIERTESAVTVPEGTFHCPECEFSTDVEATSLRAGDFCPECHKGSLEHRRPAE